MGRCSVYGLVAGLEVFGRFGLPEREAAFDWEGVYRKEGEVWCGVQRVGEVLGNLGNLPTGTGESLFKP